MRNFNVLAAMFLSGAILLSSCAGTSNTTKGGVIGGASGALIGAGIGALAGKGKGAAIGAAVGIHLRSRTIMVLLLCFI